MVVCDGFLLAWVLTEFRRAGFDDAGEDRFHPAHALELMPAPALACLVPCLPDTWGRSSSSSCAPADLGRDDAVGRYIRWQFGWGLIDLQAASLVVVGIVGVVAAGAAARSARCWAGSGGCCVSEGGHLTAAIAMAGAACVLAGPRLRGRLAASAGGAGCSPRPTAMPITRPCRSGSGRLPRLIELAQRSLPVAGCPATARRATRRGARAEAAHRETGRVEARRSPRTWVPRGKARRIPGLAGSGARGRADLGRADCDEGAVRLAVVRGANGDIF